MLQKAAMFTIATLLMLGACASDSAPPEPEPARQLSAGEKSIVASQHDFGINLLQTINRQEPDTNLFISPLSVSMALGMTYNGAREQTKTAMEEALALQGMDVKEINESYHSLMQLLMSLDPKVTFEIANSVWYRSGLAVEDDFQQTVASSFGATIEAMNFDDPSSVDRINGWVNEKTRGKIPTIVDDIKPHIVMFLINATYFKGIWTSEFDPDNTQTDKFYSSDENIIDCKFMSQHAEFDYMRKGQFEMVDLPYGDGDFSMTVILPDTGSSVGEVIESLSPATWSNWLSSLQSTEMDLFLPKFKLEYKLTLNDALKAMGMAVAFDPAAADLTGIAEGDLFIDRVLHKTFVQVDEEGTEAAAVTSVEVGVTSVKPQIQVKVDRPFLFAIRDSHTDALIFIGKIVSPSFSQ